MDAAQWAKDVRNDGSYSQVQDKQKVKPQHEDALNCPRCNSTNTKFCYYNNYSLTQPRYFCKACKRYWTKGGSLRSVPVGGGSRKNKRSLVSSSSSASSAMAKPIDLSQFSSQNFNTTHEAHQDLNLGSQEDQYHHHHHGFSQFLKLPKIENANANATFLSSHNLTCSNGLNTSDPTNVNTMFNGARFTLEDFKPTMSFPANFQGNGIKYGNQEDGERVMLPFGVLNQQQHHPPGQSMAQPNSNAYWINGTMGEGSSTLYN